MSNLLERLATIEKGLEKKKREQARLEGAFEQTMSQAKKDFGCSTLEELQELLEKTKKDNNKTEEKLQAALEEYEESFGNKLE